ncbi:MAG: 2-hydroxyacid dehydrogenase [Alphaproteobacteria bacterium]|nr:2-hydroxyacid dehydrogenase [Alphaproteobacteria bacterium]
MAPKIIVVCPSSNVTGIAEGMAPAGFETVVVPHGDPSIDGHLADASYFVCYPNVDVGPKFHAKARNLKLLQLLSAGYDAIDIDAAREAGVPVCNNGGANAISVSEHAIMLMLTVARRVVWQHASVSAGRWRGNGPAPRMYELSGKTLGIVGLGNIGKKTARLGKAFGMNVIYYDIKRLSEDEADQAGVKFRVLRELLRESDFISLHVPLNDSTRHMIGRAELEEMKPEAILVNTARGPVIDEKALYEHLSAGKIFGAGLDVFDQEPPPSDNPLFKLDNVLLTAHFAGPTWDNHSARFRNAFDNVLRVERGEAPLWVVPELLG